MAWVFDLKAKKNSNGYTITASVLKSPNPGVYSDWDAPHVTWESAIANALQKLEAQHSDGDKYIVDGASFDSPNEALAALKCP